MAITQLEEQFIKIFKSCIKITAYTISIKTLLAERNLKRIDYSPYYQRNYVWDVVKQSFFIESVILGTEIPPLIFFKSAGLKMEVIDGRQRFETLKRFKENQITLNSKGLMSLVDIDKQSFNRLVPESLKEVFLESNIRVFEFEIVNVPNLNSLVEDKVKKEIFRRYNTGITPLTTSEVYNARYLGDELTDLFKTELSLKAEFYNSIKKCFFSHNLDVDDSEMVNYLRKLFILNSFPITRYASGQSRNEVIDLLYEFATQGLDNVKEEFELFKSHIYLLHDIYLKFVKHDSINNRFVNECIFWGIRILSNEGIEFDILKNINVLITHYRDSVNLYTRDDHHYYSSIVERFKNTVNFFQKIVDFNFDIYLSNGNFTKELNSKIESEKNSIKKTDNLTHLRINKPSPIATPVDEIRADVKTTRYLLRPPYQRKEKITEFKASSIIESILLGISLPPIFVLKRVDGIKEVIDGQQRLLSILAFLGEQYMDEHNNLRYSNNNAFKLKSLKVLSELNGSNYFALSEEQRDKILDFPIDVIFIDQNINPSFQATDLFIRLNNKPYPIKANSFEMWNSTIDREVIQKIKEVTVRHLEWFYIRKTSLIESERHDRMENEELITLLSYINYICRTKSYDEVIDFHLRQERISCRVKSKSVISDFLGSLDVLVIDKENFLIALDETEKLIQCLYRFNSDEEFLSRIFNIKNISTFRRTSQDFYILWILLSHKNFSDINPLTENFISDFQRFLGFVKNIKEVQLDSNYFKTFIKEFNEYIYKQSE